MIDAARRQMRRQAWATVAILGVGACFYAIRPTYTTVTTSSGRTYDVVQILHNSETNATVECGIHSWSELVILYYPRTHDSAGLTRDADDLTELAASASRQTGDSLLVIRQDFPVVTRWYPLWISNDVRYELVAGRWVSAADGPWPPWMRCGPPSKPIAF